MIFDRRFNRYDFKIDLPRLKAEAHTLLYDHSNGVYHTQRSLQTDGSANWNSSTGSQPNIDESVWDQLHPDLANTWWQEFFDTLPLKVYRARLLTIQSRTCYSIHSDRTPRIHIAIDTHPQARFIFTTPPAIRHIPADGHPWWVDTREEHSAMNGSLKPRIHFVACLDNTDSG